MKSKILILSLFLLQYVYCDESCRKELECSEECYCIRACNYETGKLDTACYYDIKLPNKMPRMVPLADMPICIEFYYSTFPGSYNYYSPATIMDEEGIKSDIEDAVRAWNCLCDFDKVDCKKKVKAFFTDDKKSLLGKKKIL